MATQVLGQIEWETEDGVVPLVFRTIQYENGNTGVEAVDAETGEPWAVLSVNPSPMQARPAPGSFYLKDWSENADLAQRFIKLGVTEADPEQVLACGYEVAVLHRIVA